LIPKLALFNETINTLRGFESYSEKFKFPAESSSDLPVYSVVFNVVGMGGAVLDKHWQAVALPNEERIRQKNGSAQLFYSNIISTRSHELLTPLLQYIISADDEDFEYLTKNMGDLEELNTIFHESSHNLPFKFTEQNVGIVNSILEEAKADIFGMLFLHHLSKTEDTKFNAAAFRQGVKVFFAHYIRRMRSDFSSRHAEGARIVINWFVDKGALTISEQGILQFDESKFQEAVQSLCAAFYKLYEAGQNGEHGGIESVHAFIEQWKKDTKALSSLFTHITNLPMPRDINTVFERPDIK